MSSSSTSSKEVFTPGQQQLDRPQIIFHPMMNLDHRSPSSPTARIVLPRPYMRSPMSPDAFDTFITNHPLLEYQHHLLSRTPRRFSLNQINDSLISNAYLSDQERSSPRSAQQQSYHQLNRMPTSGKRAVISVSANQSPFITIASGGLPGRSEIRLSAVPLANKSTVHEIRISRPDSPSISINRTGVNQPITVTTTNATSGTITNGSAGAFHISLEAPTSTAQSNQRSFHQIELLRDSNENRYVPANVIPNRFTPSMAYTNSNNSSTYDRPAVNPNSPPISKTVPLQIHKDPESCDVINQSNEFFKAKATPPSIFGMCARCNDDIVGEENGLIAMDRMYHVSCFTCTMCGCRLRGMHFYSMENIPYCESCYINSLEKCASCSRPITDRILRAAGKPYHAQCFCCITCKKVLDGIAFTVDATMQIHCIDCFHEKFAPRCYACHRIIVPTSGQEETVRIIAFDRSYHVECYRCENCQVLFTNDEGCYPIDDHILCLDCNQQYSNAVLGQS